MTKRKLKKNVKILFIILVSIGLLLIISCSLYLILTRPIDKTSTVDVQLTIQSGTSRKGIAKLLKENNLIRSEILFDLVSRFHKKTLKAATYQLQRSMSQQEIIDVLTNGSKYNPDIIRLTFLEGEGIKKYALNIATNTDNTYEDVMNTLANQSYLQTLINEYWFLTDEILNENIYVSLEGYLAPNTYEFKNRKVEVTKIIETMLDQTELELEPYKNNLGDYTIHQYLTMASMLELEGIKYDDRRMIAGVFYNRLKKGMNMGSDVTTYYALQKEMKADLTADEFKTINPYNTRAANMGGKLPIGPICNPSVSSIKASIKPSINDYLFFVADKNGKIYYSKTESDHTQKVIEIKEAGNWIW